MVFRFAILFSNLLRLVLADSLPEILDIALIARAGSGNNIVVRQITTQPPGQVPTACQPDCDPIAQEVNQQGGCTPSECCQASFVQGFYNCILCVGKALNLTDYSPPQQTLDELTASCDARGFNTPKLTLPNIDPHRPLPSAPANSTNGGSQSTTISLGSLTTLRPPPLSLTTAPGPVSITPLSPPPTPAPSSLSSPNSSPSAAQSSSTPSAAESLRFSAPGFSHLSTIVVLLAGLMYFEM